MDTVIKFMKQIFDMEAGHVLIISINGMIHFTNSNFNKFLDLPMRNPIGINIHKYISAESFKQLSEIVFNSNTEDETEIVLHIGKSNKEYKKIKYICRSIISENKVLYHVLISENINKLNLFSDFIKTPQNIAFFSVDNEYNFTSFNDRQAKTMKAVWGVDIEFGANAVDVISNENDKIRVKSNFDRALKGEVFALTQELGTSHRRNHYFSPIKENGKVIGVNVFIVDVSDHQKHDLTLQKLLISYEAVHENSLDMIMNLDEDLVPTFQNRSSQENMNFDKYPNFIDHVHEEDRELFQEEIDKCFDGEAIKGLVFRIYDKSHNIIYIQLNATKIEVEGKKQLVAIARDITLNKKIEFEQLRERNLESLSFLAGGIAHDFNNILVSIVGNTSLLEIQDVMDDTAKEIIADIKIASNRAKDLASQLLTFSKGGDLVRRPRNLIAIITESINLAFSGKAINSELIVEISKNTVIDLDKGQITNLFNNLYINAIQAMKNRGIITTRIYRVSREEMIKENLDEKDYICVEIIDKGPGIPEDIQNKIFSPFFTTKSKGTGLGLSMSYNIAIKHNGKLNFRSSSEGTTFYLYLPISHRKIVEEDHKREDYYINFDGKILILDDDKEVQRTLSKMLDRINIGHKIFSNGDRLIKHYKKNINKYTVVILDLTLKTGKSGMDTYDEISKINPDVKVIVSSGYSNDPIMSNYARIGFKTVLPKPYSIDELIHAIQTAISHI